MNKEKKHITKDIVPDHFTLSLAIVDAIPVLVFCASMVLIGISFKSLLFVFGAALVLFAGTVKVLWKVIVVLRKKNVWWMFVQMRILMPIGMVLMIISLVINHKQINGAAILAAMTAFPAVVFFGIGILGMVLMTVFAFRLDASDARSNWIEQITNGIAQICIFLGILMCMN